MPKHQEIEAKFLEVNPKELDHKFTALGAKKQYKKLFRRYVFDYPDLRLNNKSAWLRLRDEGQKVTFTYKQRTGVKPGSQDSGMKEIEVQVSDFDNTAEILLAIGLKPKFYEENWRTLYILDDVELCIDEWPMIPPYLEIEADSWDKVDGTAKKLGYDPKQKLIGSTMQVYEKYGINEMEYKVITFAKQEKS